MILYKETNSQDEIPIFVPKVMIWPENEKFVREREAEIGINKRVPEMYVRLIFLGNSEQEHKMDRIYLSLASMGSLHSALCYELEQLYYNAVAADLFGKKLVR